MVVGPKIIPADGWEWEWEWELEHNNMGLGMVNACRLPKSFPRIS